jgi:hypothetical protein
MSAHYETYELKERAKWSAKDDERKSAINELANQGQDAVIVLEEIRDVIVGEELRNLTILAIENIRNNIARKKEE